MPIYRDGEALRRIWELKREREERAWQGVWKRIKAGKPAFEASPEEQERWDFRRAVWLELGERLLVQIGIGEPNDPMPRIPEDR